MRYEFHPEALEEYKRYHAAVWPEVLKTITRCNIRNYSIYLKDGYLFGYFEYHGTDYKADMARMAGWVFSVSVRAVSGPSKIVRLSG